MNLKKGGLYTEQITLLQSNEHRVCSTSFNIDLPRHI